MTDFFSEFRTLPQEFVDLGALVPVSLFRPDTSTFDPKTLRKTAGTGETFTGHGSLSTVKTTASDGAMVMTTLAKLTVEPKIGDKLTIGSAKPFNVVGVTTIQPDGNAFFWTAILS